MTTSTASPTATPVTTASRSPTATDTATTAATATPTAGVAPTSAGATGNDDAASSYEQALIRLDVSSSAIYRVSTSALQGRLQRKGVVILHAMEQWSAQVMGEMSETASGGTRNQYVTVAHNGSGTAWYVDIDAQGGWQGSWQVVDTALAQRLEAEFGIIVGPSSIDSVLDGLEVIDIAGTGLGTRQLRGTISADAGLYLLGLSVILHDHAGDLEGSFPVSVTLDAKGGLAKVTVTGAGNTVKTSSGPLNEELVALMRGATATVTYEGEVSEAPFPLPPGFTTS